MSDVALSFVLLSEVAYPDPAAIIANAARMGVDLAHEMGDPETLTFRVAGGATLFVALMSAPHPDAATMPVGPTSPEPSIVQQHRAHCVVTILGAPEGPLLPEVLMGIVTAAVVASSPAVAAMHGHGAIFHRADVFAAMVEASGHEIPTEITVDITAAQEGPDRMSFLTHGLQRYGREEFYLTAPIRGQGALDYLMTLVRWMVQEPDKVLPTGDTIGRTAEERILVQRVASPIEGNPDVIRLDLDVEHDDAATAPAAPNKSGFFRRRR